ncbi:MAG: UPF0280 family protein [Actinobacteria bacterium]|nr:UPF0280 family protein [Actinomycetota bacterium]
MGTGKYAHRFYRESMHAVGLVPFRVVLAESDLYIFARRDLSEQARLSLSRHRSDLEGFIARQPLFASSFRPYQVPDDAPAVVRAMAEAAGRAGVGPMAAVAGAVADMVGGDLAPLSDEIIVENGGDIHMRSARPRRVGVFAGDSAWSGRLALRVGPTPPEGIGICTSSATVGPSYSAGAADCALVVAESAALADAAASALGNRAKTPERIEEALDAVCSIEGVTGCLLIMGEHLGVRGALELE